MDSGNSGSMQSSSGNDEQEFDSLSISRSTSFMNPSPQYPFLTQQNPTNTFFDNHQPFTQSNPNPNYGNNNDLIWSRGLRSEIQQNYPNFGNLTLPSSSSVQQQQQQASYPSPSSTAHPSRASSSPSDQLSNVIKNPKKRTRASRRAPTTVLTTDTTNFRQMVQEFTGIPASPFSGSPYSRRPDLFSGLRPNPHLDTLGPLYPLRPSANKIFSSFPSSSSSHNSLLNSTMVDSIVPATNIVASTTGGVASTSNNSNDYSDHRHHHHLMNLQQLGGNNAAAARMNFGSLSGFLSGHEVRNINNNDDHNITTRWRSSGENNSNNNDGVGENNNLVTFDGNFINSTNSGDHHNSQHHVTVSGSYNLNLSDKSMENVGASSGTDQGNVASWICPSD